MNNVELNIHFVDATHIEVVEKDAKTGEERRYLTERFMGYDKDEHGDVDIHAYPVKWEKAWDEAKAFAESKETSPPWYAR